MKTTYSNYDNISTYDEHGFSDYSNLLDDFDAASDIANKQAGIVLSQNLQDGNAQTGLALAGWNPKKNEMKAQAVDWWKWGEIPSTPFSARANEAQTSNLTIRHLKVRWCLASRQTI